MTMSDVEGAGRVDAVVCEWTAAWSGLDAWLSRQG